MRWSARLSHLLRHVNDSPPRVAAAFGVGLFIAFFPLPGVHTCLALGLALWFRLSKIATLAGAWVNNPWTIAPMYGAGTLLGCALLGIAPVSPSGVDWSLEGRAFYSSLATSLTPLVWPFVIGNLVLGVIAGIGAFFVLKGVLVRRGARAAAQAAADNDG